MEVLRTMQYGEITLVAQLINGVRVSKRYPVVKPGIAGVYYGHTSLQAYADNLRRTAATSRLDFDENLTYPSSAILSVATTVKVEGSVVYEWVDFLTSWWKKVQYFFSDTARSGEWRIKE